jgi:hypothetical protein
MSSATRASVSSVTRDPALVAERGGQRLPQRQRAVFGGVVLVDMQVAIDLHRHVDQRMLGELFDHVVEKADPGADIIAAAPVEAHLDENPGFRCVSFDPTCTHASRARAARAKAQENAPTRRVKTRLNRLTPAPRSAT